MIMTGRGPTIVRHAETLGEQCPLHSSRQRRGKSRQIRPKWSRWPDDGQKAQGSGGRGEIVLDLRDPWNPGQSGESAWRERGRRRQHPCEPLLDDATGRSRRASQRATGRLRHAAVAAGWRALSPTSSSTAWKEQDAGTGDEGGSQSGKLEWGWIRFDKPDSDTSVVFVEGSAATTLSEQRCVPRFVRLQRPWSAR